MDFERVVTPEALRRISFARFSSRFSRSIALSRWRSSVVKPGRRPVSSSTARTQWRRVPDERPIFAAMDRTAARYESCSRSCSSTIRTARSRTSGEYRLRLPMESIRQEIEP